MKRNIMLADLIKIFKARINDIEITPTVCVLCNPKDHPFVRDQVEAGTVGFVTFSFHHFVLTRSNLSSFKEDLRNGSDFVFLLCPNWERDQDPAVLEFVYNTLDSWDNET